VIDIAGRVVRVLADRESLAPGPQDLKWDARDARGARVPSGIYLIQARAGDEVAVRKVLVIP
jgi:flagellar hook assembly protein FlgD